MTSSVVHTPPPIAPAFPEGLPLTKVTVPSRDQLLSRLDDILASGTLTNGPTVRALEHALAEQLDVPYVLGVSSCTAGLMLVLRGLQIAGPVAVPSFTFSASAHAVDWVGGTPVFIDIDEHTLTADVADSRKVADGSAAILATHVYGTPADVEGLQAVSDELDVPLIFDAAHALGSTRRGTPIGSFGRAEVFSLSPTKVVTGGEGGIVATRDESLAHAVRVGRDYGNPGNYDTQFVGLNARMSELHAAVALASLSTLDERLAARNRTVELFRSAIAAIPGLRIPGVNDGDTSTYKDLTVVVDAEQFGLTAGELSTALKSHGVDSRRYFYPPVHQQKAYAHLLPGRPLPVTERISAQVLTLPLWADMEDALVLRLADLLADLHSGTSTST
jgi:dTDP-4-amino-4,6-dideoxygalactose transaminase